MIEKTRQVHGRLNSYDKKKYKFKTKKRRENLNTCGKELKRNQPPEKNLEIASTKYCTF